MYSYGINRMLANITVYVASDNETKNKTTVTCDIKNKNKTTFSFKQPQPNLKRYNNAIKVQI